MAEIMELKAETREGRGKSSARDLRREGRLPAILYGDAKEPEAISLDFREIAHQLQTGTFLSTVFMLDVSGQATRAIPRDVQVDPVRDYPIHVDFLRLGEGATITVEVPVNFINEEESPGLKRGGILNVVRHTVELLCPADQIPESIEADLTGLDIGDTVHISAIKLPENVEPTITDRDFTVASIAGRMAEPVEDEEGEEDELLEEGEEPEEGEEGETEED